MSAQIKVARLLGAVLVSLALVPWLGISPAAASGGSDNESPAAQGRGNNNKTEEAKAANDDKPANGDMADKAAEKAAAKVERKANSRADKKPAGKAEVKTDVKADTGAASSSSSSQKVTLCHRTNSETNPYVRITVSISSVVKSSGHDGHNGPVYVAGMKAAHQKWGDIIPAFSYDGGSYAGKNWTAGAAIHGAACEAETGGGHSTPPTTITVTATPSDGGGGTSQKVTLCHRTNSDSNPYVRITVSIHSVIKSSGHDGHNGPVYAAGMKAAHQKWGDIIPSFTYPSSSGSTASYGGKNWPAGQAIFDAGCGASQTTSTTSVSPSGTQTATTPGTSVLPTKIGTDDTGVLGARTGVLPRTGLDLPLGVVLAVSFLLLLAGGALIVVPSLVNTERNRRH